MIRSMTGFGRCELVDGTRKITVEVKTVNHRYLDISTKMPKKFNIWENDIRNILKEYLERGKVDLYISYADDTESRMTLRYNANLAAEYVGHIKQIAEDFDLEFGLTAAALSRSPEVLFMEEQPMDEDALWQMLKQALHTALEQLAAFRSTEGENLKKDMLTKLMHLKEMVAQIEERFPQILEEYRQKLTNKVQELLGDKKLDEARLATEVTLYADRICTDEELVRLKSHISGTIDTLNAGGCIGRKLDFLVQEMNRESNTILSKSTDLTVANIGIEMKTEIEKLREQLQNIE